MHENEIYNLNIKPENLLSDDWGNLKLWDYLANDYMDLILHGKNIAYRNQSEEKT